MRQRLSLAVAMIHEPEMLILDEPTSGVDPVARDIFWQMMIDLSRQRRRDDLHLHPFHERGRALRPHFADACRPGAGQRRAGRADADSAGRETLEEAFIAYLEGSLQRGTPQDRHCRPRGQVASLPAARSAAQVATVRVSAWPRCSATPCAKRSNCVATRSALHLALLGTAILMFIFGYGITLDVENLPLPCSTGTGPSPAATISLNLAGSHYFIEKPPINDYDDLDRRMRSGEMALAIEIPPDFARDIARGTPVRDRRLDRRSHADPRRNRARLCAGHASDWLAAMAQRGARQNAERCPVNIETRFRYNPDVKSIFAMVPAVIPMLLMMIPAMLTALAWYGKKNWAPSSISTSHRSPGWSFCSASNCPTSSLAMLNFLLLTSLAVLLFGVPLKGSLPALTLAALLLRDLTTGFGLLISTFTRSQIAALFGTAIVTIIPYRSILRHARPGLLAGRRGRLHRHDLSDHAFPDDSRGIFTKGLGFRRPAPSFWPLLVARARAYRPSVRLAAGSRSAEP